MSTLYDITIIGGGPVGMFAAFYAGMRQASTKIIESLPILGGQPYILYPEKMIYDVGGYASITGAELTDQLIQQMNHFNPTICLEEKVLMIEKEADQFKLTTTKGTHYSKTVIIATGQGSFKPRRLPFNYPEVFEQTNLHYIVRNLEQYRDKKVAICGGGDSAVDWALALEEVASEVSLIHRRNQFRAHEGAVQQLEQSSVQLLTPYIPKQLHSSDNRQIDQLTLSKKRSNDTLTIDIDYLIVNYGFVSAMDEVSDWGIQLDSRGILVDRAMTTTVPGMFAIGDVAHYDEKIKLIAVGFGEAPTAINHAMSYIDPTSHKQPIQSTELYL
ncbi:NAD(P)/FAD-dependent oxidoreductase [Dolosigranulum pigrum]|uniref:NAD(P)/FAD-dependent oxidoreductase n=1 Tax=Dolosigranulum pigrum TaxID=29394 RepID=UPI001AD86752|nr:NAD(P)/FAD-dependent oxidoreductase [Dolosigranulum pigrum]QTJ43586.1 NAD(P)/FAD-dependent oxidoreductase [Dolosigranulum pigrum]QTJ47002.1 NAD(P)/FAD-dependent oxidoreductase [Dolosigranulum pigrum]QTJ60523.1 NAD(P)/FAD-dependent oxidoreductase [Dolosigranulum pigrum]